MSKTLEAFSFHMPLLPQAFRLSVSQAAAGAEVLPLAAAALAVV